MEPEKIYDLLAGDKFWQIHRGRYVFVESRHNNICELLLGKKNFSESQKISLYCILYDPRKKRFS